MASSPPSPSNSPVDWPPSARIDTVLSPGHIWQHSSWNQGCPRMQSSVELRKLSWCSFCQNSWRSLSHHLSGLGYGLTVSRLVERGLSLERWRECGQQREKCLSPTEDISNALPATQTINPSLKVFAAYFQLWVFFSLSKRPPALKWYGNSQLEAHQDRLFALEWGTQLFKTLFNATRWHSCHLLPPLPRHSGWIWALKVTHRFSEKISSWGYFPTWPTVRV